MRGGWAGGWRRCPASSRSTTSTSGRSPPGSRLCPRTFWSSGATIATLGGASIEDLLLQEYGIAHDAPGRSRRATRASVDSDASMSQSEEESDRLDRELIEVLNELRVVLPGVQVLFAFLLTVPFSNQFSQITNQQRQVYFATFLCTTAATALIAPSAYHRLRWREYDKEQLLRNVKPAFDRRDGLPEPCPRRRSLPRHRPLVPRGSPS